MDGKEKLFKAFEERKEEIAELVTTVGLSTLVLKTVSDEDEKAYYTLVLKLCGWCAHLFNEYGCDELWND